MWKITDISGADKAANQFLTLIAAYLQGALGGSK